MVKSEMIEKDETENQETSYKRHLRKAKSMLPSSDVVKLMREIMEELLTCQTLI